MATRLARFRNGAYEELSAPIHWNSLQPFPPKKAAAGLDDDVLPACRSMLAIGWVSDAKIIHGRMWIVEWR
jgi:hypothetical protein